MKNLYKLIGIIALAAVIGFSFIACDLSDLGGTHTHLWSAWQSNATQHWKQCDCGEEYGRANHTFNGDICSVCNYNKTGGKTTYSLDGAWKVNTTDAIVIISGSTGVITQWQTSNALWQSAKDKGYINIGDQWFRNLTKTGDLTWTGQSIAVTYNNSSPNVATGTTWQNCTITMNANGQTFQSTTPTGTSTYTRISPSLDGVWQNATGNMVITISGSTGVYTQLGSTTSALWTDARNKGYVNIGDQSFRNLAKTGDLTWTGQSLGITYNNSAPNVATGTTWQNCTITMNTNGQTFQSTASTGTATYTRQ